MRQEKYKGISEKINTPVRGNPEPAYLDQKKRFAGFESYRLALLMAALAASLAAVEVRVAPETPSMLALWAAINKAKR